MLYFSSDGGTCGQQEPFSTDRMFTTCQLDKLSSDLSHYRSTVQPYPGCEKDIHIQSVCFTLLTNLSMHDKATIEVNSLERCMDPF